MKKAAALDTSTEERIKAAARKVFTQKGYAATRVRDIAQEADLNIALLNYYFRSKEKLFDLVMGEKLHEFGSTLQQIMTNETTSLHEKVAAVSSFYIDLLLAQPELPVFIFSELKANPDKLVQTIGVKKIMLQSHFVLQLRQALGANHSQLDPLQLLMSLLSMAVFPFIARPVLQLVGNKSPAEFEALMQERKQLIPKWFDAMLNTA